MCVWCVFAAAAAAAVVVVVNVAVYLTGRILEEMTMACECVSSVLLFCLSCCLFCVLLLIRYTGVCTMR